MTVDYQHEEHVRFDTRPRGKSNKDEDSKATTLTEEERESIVSRLTRPIMTTARRSVLWSKPRRDFEFTYRNCSYYKTPESYQDNYNRLQKHYGGTRNSISGEQLDAIVKRLSKPTSASQLKANDSRARRNLIEQCKENNDSADVGVQTQRSESRGRNETPDRQCHSAVSPRRGQSSRSPSRGPTPRSGSPRGKSYQERNVKSAPSGDNYG